MLVYREVPKKQDPFSDQAVGFIAHLMHELRCKTYEQSTADERQDYERKIEQK